MKMTRREFMDGVSVAALMVGVASLGFELSDPPLLEIPPEPVRLSADLEATVAGSASLTVSRLA